MTLAELRALQTDFLNYDLDNFSGESPTAAQQDAQINRALRVIGKELFIVDPKVGFSPKYNKAVYSLDDLGTVTKRVVKPFYVTINGNKLWDWSGDKYGLWGFNRFVHDNPNWESADVGTTTKAVVYGNRGLILHVPPNEAIQASTSNFIAGQVIPTELKNGPDVPEIPVDIHESLAYMAAIYAAMPNCSEQEAWARLEAYNKQWRADVKIVRNENHRAWHHDDEPQRDHIDYIEL